MLSHTFKYKSWKREESARFLYDLSCEGHFACLPRNPSDFERLRVRDESIQASALTCEEENLRVIEGH